MEHYCAVCSNVVGNAHTCYTCNKFVHIICGIPEGEEGFGQKLKCNNCTQKAETEGDQHSHVPKTANSLKRKLNWDWLKGGMVEQPIPKKIQKISETYVCLECLERSLKGNFEEKNASICRKNASTIDRHKRRWHTTTNNYSCTVVPSSAPDVRQLYARYAKAKKFYTEAPKDNSRPKTTNALASTSHSTSQKTLLSFYHSKTVEDPIQPTEQGTHQNSKEVAPLTKACSDLPELGDQEFQENNSNFADGTKFTKPNRDSSRSTSQANIDDVMKALTNLSLKVEDFGKRHNNLEQLVAEDNEVLKSLSAMRTASNINQLAEASKYLEFFYDDDSGTGLLRCNPCFKMQVTARPTLNSLSPLQAQRIINSCGTGTLGTGKILSNDVTQLLIEGHNQTWYRQKKLCIDHMCLLGDGNKLHKKAMETLRKEEEREKKRSTAASNIFRAAIVDLKLGAAARHLETLISFLSCCSVDVGNIGHSRNNFNDILSCFEKSVNRRINSWLNEPLPSTLLPPHFWATIDKATPSRTTNQAVLVVARNENGIPCPIPVAAPQVYKEFAPATYDAMAELLIKSIKDNFSKDVLSRLCGIAADGPYQAAGFRERLLQELGIEDIDNNQLSFPVTWDAAHLLNLGVVEVKDRSSSSDHFKTFLNRCNVFNTILANGKGFAFLQLVDKEARRPVAYAAQRFASSSYEQWLKIEKSYSALWKAFDMLYPNRTEDEQYQYMIAGSDFIADLLSFLDILEPVVDLMLRVQSLDVPIWKLKLWWPKVKAKLEKAANGDANSFPRLQEVGDSFHHYQGVELLPGWLVTNQGGGDGGRGVLNWTQREEVEIEQDRLQLASDLMNALDRRVQTILHDRCLSTLQVFDASALVALQCGTCEDDILQKDVSDGEYEMYGVEECQAVLAAVSKMTHIVNSGMDFDPRLAFRFMEKIKKAVKIGIWDGLCLDWFVLAEGTTALPVNSKLTFFKPVETKTLDTMFKLRFQNGQEFTVRLQEQSFYRSFYSNKAIYSIATPSCCTLLDIVLSKGGPEAIAESFYNSMRAQQQSGGQSNENLARRTKLNWCLPPLKKCDDIIKEAVRLYFTGDGPDGTLRRHRSYYVQSSRANEYLVSKVVDRLDGELGRCPFLANE